MEREAFHISLNSLACEERFFCNTTRAFWEAHFTHLDFRWWDQLPQLSL